MGMNLKRKEREKKELEEAKNLGLYHRSIIIKHIWAASAKKKSSNRKDRGIGVGLGKVKYGILTLSSQDIRRVQNAGVKKNGKAQRDYSRNCSNRSMRRNFLKKSILISVPTRKQESNALNLQRYLLPNQRNEIGAHLAFCILYRGISSESYSGPGFVQSNRIKAAVYVYLYPKLDNDTTITTKCIPN